MPSSIKAVIFDLGGVVFSSPIGRLGEVERKIGLEHNSLNRHIGNCKTWGQMERGEITPTQFVYKYDIELKEMVKDGNANKELLQVSGKRVMEAISAGDTIARRGYYETLMKLHKLGIKTLALTNNFQSDEEDETTDESEGIPGQAKTVQEIFDVVIESSIVGLRKPDVRIYELALKEAGNIKANEAVFLDDIGANLKPARKMGIHTIRVMVDDIDGIDALIKLEKIIGEELFVTGRPVKSKL